MAVFRISHSGTKNRKTKIKEYDVWEAFHVHTKIYFSYQQFLTLNLIVIFQPGRHNFFSKFQK